MITCQRNAFNLVREDAYLNCAYQGPLANNVYAIGQDELHRKQQPWKIQGSDFFDPPNELRASFAKLIGASEKSRVAILASASYGLAQVSRNCGISAGQKIVLLAEQFPSNYYTWKRLAEETNAEIVVVGSGRPEGFGYNEALLQAIDSSCALVSIAPVHWADGVRYDLEAVARKCKAVGAKFIIDGTQAVGALPLDVSKIQPDALIVAGYKWLLGPYSTALGWFGPAFDQGVPIEENWINRKDSDRFASLVNYEDAYQPEAARYNVGQPSNFMLVPMLNQSIKNILGWGVANIQEYCRELTHDTCNELRELGCLIAPSEERAHHLFGIRLGDAIDSDKLTAALKTERVHLSRRGDALRVSPNVYNDEEDMAKLLKCFQLARKKQLH